MDNNFTNDEFTIHKTTVDQLVAKVRSFSHQCAKAVKDMQDSHIEKMKKKKGLRDNDYDNQDRERRLAKYVAIIRNHSLRDWFPSPYDPNQLITLFSCLRIKEGYHLEAYQHLDSYGNGRAKIFVIPDNRTLPKRPPQKILYNSSRESLLASMGISDNMQWWKKLLCMGYYFLLGIILPSYRSLPKWADSEIENYIEGDGSPLSYFQASIFVRELHELGARWHCVYWGHHKFVTSPDDILYEDWIHEKPTPIDWTWDEPEPEEWCPVVWKDKDQRWNVTFHTINMMQAMLVSHQDTFDEGYKYTTSSYILAVYPGKYVV